MDKLIFKAFIAGLVGAVIGFILPLIIGYMAVAMGADSTGAGAVGMLVIITVPLCSILGIGYVLVAGFFKHNVNRRNAGASQTTQAASKIEVEVQETASNNISRLVIVWCVSFILIGALISIVFPLKSAVMGRLVLTVVLIYLFIIGRVAYKNGYSFWQCFVLGAACNISQSIGSILLSGKWLYIFSGIVNSYIIFYGLIAIAGGFVYNKSRQRTALPPTA